MGKLKNILVASIGREGRLKDKRQILQNKLLQLSGEGGTPSTLKEHCGLQWSYYHTPGSMTFSVSNFSL